MSTATLHQPSGAPASAGGQFMGHRRADGPGLGADDVTAASSATTAPRALSKLTYSKDEAVRVAAAGNPRTPAKDLERMLNRGPAVRSAVLRNPGLSKAVALTVARAPRGTDLADLALNPKLSAEVQDLCTPAPTTKAAPRIRLADIEGDPRDVAADPETPPQVLTALSYSRDVFVRQAVAKNPMTPAPVIKRLLFLGPTVRAMALRNPGLNPDDALFAAKYAMDDDLSNLAANPAASGELLEICSKSGGMAPFRVGAHANTPPAVFERYVATGGAQLMEVIAANEAAPTAIRTRAVTRLAEINDALAAPAAS